MFGVCGALSAMTLEIYMAKRDAPSMSTEPSDEAETVEASAGHPPDPAASTAPPAPDEEMEEGILEWLERAMPDVSSVTFSDISGTEHTAATLLPARSQFAIARSWKQVLDQVPASDMAVIRSGEADYISLILRMIMKAVAEDEEIENLLYQTFERIHAPAIRAAREGLAGEIFVSVSDPTDDAQPWTPEGADLFSAEEMVASIIPFSFRIIQRAAKML